jgi:hypothetical protein
LGTYPTRLRIVLPSANEGFMAKSPTTKYPATKTMITIKMDFFILFLLSVDVLKKDLNKFYLPSPPTVVLKRFHV